MIYYLLNNPFTADCGSPALNINPITIDDITSMNNRYRYTPDLIPAAISVASENFVGTLATPYDSPPPLLIPYDDPILPHEMRKDQPYCVRVKIRYCSKKYD